MPTPARASATRRTAMLPLFGSFLATALPGQATTRVVVPSNYATTEANSLDQEPFGNDQIRSLQLIDRSILGAIPVNTTLIQEIAYRRDGQTVGLPTMTRTRNLPPNWQIRLGNYTGNYLAASPTFPTVSDVNYTTVYQAKPTLFPPLPLVNGGGPQNWDLVFPLDVPWQFKGPGLAIENYCYESTQVNYNYYIDAIDVSASGESVGPISATSTGCPLGQNRASGVSASPGVGDLELLLQGAPANKPAIASFGTSSTFWNSVPLPLDLTSLGLPTCKVYTDLAVQVGTLTSSSGSAEFRFGIPANPLFAGAVLYGQWVVADSRVNSAINLATSDGLRFKIGNVAQAAMTTVSAQGQFASGTTGYVLVGRGYPVRFGW